MPDEETITITRAASPAEAAVGILLPRRIGNVRLMKEIGQGGMGVVWRGRDEMLARDVAVKFLLHAVADAEDPHFGRFLEGARAAAAVRHPGLTTVHHAEIVQGLPYLVMEYISGATLSDVLRQTGPLRLSAATALLDAVCAAVGALHEAGVLHRDIKPANVLLDSQGRVYVTDFGLACPRRRLSDFASESRPFFAAGTPAYMAPETFDGEVSPRSDVYALGIMTFQLLTAALPFAGDVAEVHQKHLEDELPAEPLRNAQVNQTLIDVIQRAAHKNPMFRYKTAGHYFQAFRQALPARMDPSRSAGELADLVARCRDDNRQEREGAADTPSSGSYYDGLSAMAARKKDGLLPKTIETPHTNAAPSSEPAATILADVTCIQCGYNLRGLKLDGRCPECGSQISPSLQSDRLLFADRRWLGKTVRGLAVLFWAGVVQMLTVLSLPITALAIRSDVAWISLWAPLIASSAFGILGIFMATATERRSPLPNRGLSSTRVTRLGAAALAVLLTLSWSRVAPFNPRLSILGAALLTLVALMRTLENMDRRIPDARLIRQSRLVVLFATVVAGILATGGIFGPSPISRTESPGWVVLVGIGLLGAVLLYAFTLGCIRRHGSRLKQIRVGSVERDKIFPALPGSPPKDTEAIAFQVAQNLSTLPTQVASPLPRFLGVMAVIIALKVLRAKAKTDPVWAVVGKAASAVLFIVLFAFPFVLSRLRRQKQLQDGTVDNFPLPSAPEGARLAATGNRDQLGPISQLMDVPFEPAIFERVYPNVKWYWLAIAAVVIGAALDAATQVISTLFKFGPLGYMFVFLLIWFVARLRPTYYRIVPGRLDIMRFAPLTNRAQILSRWNLRSARIRVAFDQKRVSLEDHGATVKIELWGISEPYKFAEALLQGAISTYPAPPLPDDQLLG